MMEKIRERANRWIHSPRAVLLMLGIITAIVFINILPNGFVMDDFDFVVNWPLIRDLRNIPRFFVNYIPPEGQDGMYSPLRTLSFSVVYALFEARAWGWHLVSILIHFLGVIAAYYLTQIFLGNRWMAFLSAVLFAVHPVHADSVTSITGSIGTIGVVLAMWSFYWYVRAVSGCHAHAPLFNETGSRVMAEDIRGFKDPRAFKRALALGLLAVFTHEVAFFLPVAIFLFDLLFSGETVSWRRTLQRTWIFFLIVGAYLVSKWVVLGAVSRGTYLFDSPFLTFLIVIKAWAHYVGVLILPVVLTHNKLIAPGMMSFNQDDFDQAAFFAQSWYDPQALLSFALLAAIFLIGVFYYRRKPFITFCVVWFYATLAPVSQMIPGPVYYAERYLYSGSWAYCALVAWGLVLVYQRFFKSRAVKRSIFLVLVFSMIAAYGIRTVFRNRDFRDWITFYERAVEMNPQSAFLKHDLALLYTEAGMDEEAERLFIEALEMQLENPQFNFSLAGLYGLMGRYDKAAQGLLQCIQLDEDFAEAYFNLGVVATILGREEEGMRYVSRAVNLWKEQGLTLEAANAFEAFQLFRLEQSGEMGYPDVAGLLGQIVDD